MASRGPFRGRATVPVALALLAVVAPAAAAGPRPVYRDPPSYRGSKVPARTVSLTPALPAPITLSAAGTFPDVTVDRAGTAHVVWNEDRGAAADVVVYCRIKRGGKACDNRAELTWDKSYDSGDDPRFNVGSAPKILQVGNQLIVLQYRYPTGTTRPDGTAGSENVLEWTSSDGGTTWAGPALAGVRDLDSLVVFGPPDDITILNFAIDPYCGQTGDPAAACVEAYKPGQFNHAEGELGTVRDANYYPSLALDNGLPVSALADLSDKVYLRRWTGTGSVIDPAMWTQPTVVSGADEPQLAGGPSGTFLLDKPAGQRHYEIRPVSTTSGSPVAGGGVQVTHGDSDRFARLLEDGSGRLTEAWEDGSNANRAKGPGLMLRSGASPGSLGAAQRIIDGENIGQIELGAAGDGGGFAVLNRTGFVNGEGEIVAAGFGSQRATGQPGLGDVPGGGLGSPGGGVVPSGKRCDELDFGRFKVDSPGGCFTRGTGASAAVFVTNGEVNLWGLRIIPDSGCRLIIDSKALQFDTSPGCGARVVVTAPAVGDVTLWHGEIHRDLSKVVPGTTLFEFPSGAFKANILGFDIGADIAVRLESDGVHIPVDLQLPPAFGGFSGHAELVSTLTGGLQLTSLHLHIGPVPLGALVINSMDLAYEAGPQSWTGSGSLSVPAGGTLDGSATFVRGAFKGAQFSYTPAVPITVGPFVYLLSIGGGFYTDPVHILATASLGAGAAAQGSAPIQVDGRFDMIFPTDGPGTFKLAGQVSVFFIHIGDAHLRFETDGYADFGGHAGFDLGPLTMDATADGFVDAGSGDFGASVNGRVELCVSVGIDDVCAGAGADTAVNNYGFAACAEILGESGGIEYPWRDFDPVAFVNPFVAAESIVDHLEFPCHTGAYHTPPPRPQRRAVRALGGTTVDVAAGLPSKTILLRGDGSGAPRVSVTGPGGSFTSEQRGKAGMVIVPKDVGAAYVVLDHPVAGAWTVTPEDGSPAIASVQVSEGFLPAQVTSARLGGQGRRRTIRYRIAHLGHGQTVQFVERGAFGGHVVGRTAKAAGTLRFAPADAKGGRRTVSALVLHDGIATASRRVGSYVAPGPVRPGAVRGLRARRHGTTVTVTWRPAGGSTRSIVRLRGPHTRLGRLVKASVHEVRLPAVRRGGRVVVTVQGLSKKLRTGPARHVRVR